MRAGDKITIEANGSSDEIEWVFGRGTFAAKGTFDGATVTLEANIADTGWVPVHDSAALTADGVVNFELSPCKIRITTSDAGGSTSVQAAIGKGIVRPQRLT